MEEKVSVPPKAPAVWSNLGTVSWEVWWKSLQDSGKPNARIHSLSAQGRLLCLEKVPHTARANGSLEKPSYSLHDIRVTILDLRDNLRRSQHFGLFH